MLRLLSYVDCTNVIIKRDQGAYDALGPHPSRSPGQAGWGFDHTGLGGSVPAYGRRVEIHGL